jgi:hypothetical protein
MAEMVKLSGRCDTRRGAADYVGTFQTGQACFRKFFPKQPGISASGSPYAMAQRRTDQFSLTTQTPSATTHPMQSSLPAACPSLASKPHSASADLQKDWKKLPEMVAEILKCPENKGTTPE